MKIISRNAQETKDFGKKLAEKMKSGDVLLLYGDLGAGKTTFVQGFAQGLGITDRILSPTFVLQRIHKVTRPDIKNLNHIDLYRIENPTEIKNLGLEEIFEDGESITLIEWADRLKNFSPKKSLPAGRQAFKLYFKYLKYDEREIDVEKI